MVAPNAENPITAICIVSDKNKAPPGFEPIVRAHDEPSQGADVWKDGFFALSRIYRYICVSKSVSPNAFVANVVADIAIVNEKDVVPPGFVPLEYTEDTREKSLRKKQLCVRSVSRDSAVDAVSDVIVLARTKKPPTGYTLAGDLDGLTVCFKYSVIPQDFPAATMAQQKQRDGIYPGLPYPIHPSTSSGAAANGISPSGALRVDVQGAAALQAAALQHRLEHSTGLASPPTVRSAVDGVPFELNPKLRAAGVGGKTDWPSFREFTPFLMDSEYSYPFRVEQQVLEQSLTP